MHRSHSFVKCKAAIAEAEKIVRRIQRAKVSKEAEALDLSSDAFVIASRPSLPSFSDYTSADGTEGKVMIEWEGDYDRQQMMANIECVRESQSLLQGYRCGAILSESGRKFSPERRRDVDIDLFKGTYGVCVTFVVGEASPGWKDYEYRLGLLRRGMTALGFDSVVSFTIDQSGLLARKTGLMDCHIRGDREVGDGAVINPADITIRGIESLDDAWGRVEHFISVIGKTGIGMSFRLIPAIGRYEEVRIRAEDLLQGWSFSLNGRIRDGVPVFEPVDPARETLPRRLIVLHWYEGSNTFVDVEVVRTVDGVFLEFISNKSDAAWLKSIAEKCSGVEFEEVAEADG